MLAFRCLEFVTVVILWFLQLPLYRARHFDGLKLDVIRFGLLDPRKLFAKSTEFGARHERQRERLLAQIPNPQAVSEIGAATVARVPQFEHVTPTFLKFPREAAVHTGTRRVFAEEEFVPLRIKEPHHRIQSRTQALGHHINEET